MFAVGSSLREARERQGLEVVDAEAATKIRAKYLKALEDENFDLLPAQTYVKGFLRSYADYLGLDGQLYVDEFNSRFASGDDDLPTVASTRRPSPRSSGRQVESGVVLVALAGIAAIAALVVVAWKWGGSPAERPRLVAPPAGPPPAAREQSGRRWVALDLRAARGDSWIRVRRNAPTGKTLFRGVLRMGDERRFAGRRLFLLVGDPQNVVVRLDGRRVRLPDGAGRLTATPRGISTTAR